MVVQEVVLAFEGYYWPWEVEASELFVDAKVLELVIEAEAYELVVDQASWVPTGVVAASYPKVAIGYCAVAIDRSYIVMGMG